MQIIKGKEAEFKQWCNIHLKDEYDAMVVRAVKRVGNAIDRGTDFKKAFFSAGKKIGLSGYQGQILQEIIRVFHPKGEDFKREVNWV